VLVYIGRRLLSGAALAILVTFITFLLLSTSFNDIAANQLGTASITPGAIAQERAQLGLNGPVLAQYAHWLARAVRGDFGTSYTTSQAAGSAVASHFGVTLSIVASALLLTLGVSLVLGITAAVRGGLADRVAQVVSLFGVLVPNLLFAIVLVYVAAIRMRLLPATGYTPFGSDPGAWAQGVVLPVLALMIGPLASLTSQVRGAMRDELRKDYIRTLRTRGLSARSIVLRHALRNAAGPALTVLSFEFIAMLGGAMFIERIFVIPGFGTFTFTASLQGDIPVVMCVTGFAVFMVVCVNLTVDVINGWLNPKARLL
jgi:peptide/nickel transport system permease protein